MYIVAVVVTGIILLGIYFLSRGRPVGQGGNVDPVEEAQVYIAYGRHREAVRCLEAHLQTRPDDDKARRLLESIRTKA